MINHIILHVDEYAYFGQLKSSNRQQNIKQEYK